MFLFCKYLSKNGTSVRILAIIQQEYVVMDFASCSLSVLIIQKMVPVITNITTLFMCIKEKNPVANILNIMTITVINL